MESLYQLIHRSLTPEGMLPEDFSLPKPDGNQIHFADPVPQCHYVPALSAYYR